MDLTAVSGVWSHSPAKQRVHTTWKATPVRLGGASGCGVHAQSPNSAGGAPALQREATRVRSAMRVALDLCRFVGGRPRPWSQHQVTNKSLDPT